MSLIDCLKYALLLFGLNTICLECGLKPLPKANNDKKMSINMDGKNQYKTTTTKIMDSHFIIKSAQQSVSLINSIYPNPLFVNLCTSTYYQYPWRMFLISLPVHFASPFTSLSGIVGVFPLYLFSYHSRILKNGKITVSRRQKYDYMAVFLWPFFSGGGGEGGEGEICLF